MRIHSPPGRSFAKSPSWAQWCIRCQGHPETPSLRNSRWDDEKTHSAMCHIFVTKTFSIYHIILMIYYNMYIYIYVNSMILYITIHYNILQYIYIYTYKLLVQSLALGSMVSLAPSSEVSRAFFMVLLIQDDPPEIQIWMEWIQEWIVIS